MLLIILLLSTVYACEDYMFGVDNNLGYVKGTDINKC